MEKWACPCGILDRDEWILIDHVFKRSRMCTSAAPPWVIFYSTGCFQGVTTCHLSSSSFSSLQFPGSGFTMLQKLPQRFLSMNWDEKVLVWKSWSLSVELLRIRLDRAHHLILLGWGPASVKQNRRTISINPEYWSWES